MKKYIYVLIYSLLLFGCESKLIETNYQSNQIVDTLDLLLVTNRDKLYFNHPGSMKSIEYPKFEKQHILDALIKFFDPSSFPCTDNKKLIDKVKKININKKHKGFIPSAVKNKLPEKVDSVEYLDMLGSRIICNIFEYKSANNTIVKLGLARNSYSYSVFNIFDYLEKEEQGFSNYIYSLDCSGYFSLAISAAGGIGENQLNSNTEAAFEADKSLLFVSGFVYLPLYASYEGTDRYSSKDSTTLAIRIKNLDAIISELGQEPATTLVTLNRNYQIILTSNSGTSKFNGKINFNASGGVNFGASIKGKSDNKVELTRSFEFNDYNTYILKKNILAPKLTVTKQDLINRKSSLLQELDKFKIPRNKK